MGAILYGALDIKTVPEIVSMENSTALSGGSPEISLNTSGNSFQTNTLSFLISAVAYTDYIFLADLCSLSNWNLG